MKKSALPPISSAMQRRLVLVILALILALVAILRLRMLDVPLERDEGEYAYAGQLLLQGIPPYVAVYNMKFPGIYGAYAIVLAVFGQSPRGIHLGLLVANAGAILLVYALGRRLFGSIAGLVAASSYAILSVGESVLGMAAHATHFVVLPALGGVLLLLKAEERSRPWILFASGICLGLALLMKQHGAVFTFFGFTYVLSSPLRRQPYSWGQYLSRAGIFSLGVSLPLAATCFALLRAGVFERFWFWTVTYARAYASGTPIADAWKSFVPEFLHLIRPSPTLWLLAGVGLVSVWWRSDLRPRAKFLTAFLLCSFLGVCPGFYFREHYFVLLLPGIAILVGAAVTSVARLLMDQGLHAGFCYGVSALLLGMAFGQSLILQGDRFFHQTPYQASRQTYGANPFPEAQEIARYISAHSGPKSRIAVLGSEPEIYFYANRRSATGYIYTYAQMEQQPYARRMQEEMIQEIEAARPEYLVLVSNPLSWLRHEKSEMLIFDWYSRYIQQHYGRVGVVDILPSGTVYRWDTEAAGYSPRSPYVTFVFRRLPAG